MWCLFARDPGQLIGRKISWPRSDPHNHRPDYPLLLGDHGAAHRILVATMPSMRSVLLPLAGLRLPAGSWATATFEAIQRVTGLPPCASFLETISFSSSRLWWRRCADIGSSCVAEQMRETSGRHLWPPELRNNCLTEPKNSQR